VAAAGGGHYHKCQEFHVGTNSGDTVGDGGSDADGRTESTVSILRERRAIEIEKKAARSKAS